MPLAELLNNYLPFIYISARVTGLFLMAPVYSAAVIPNPRQSGAYYRHVADYTVRY